MRSVQSRRSSQYHTFRLLVQSMSLAEIIASKKQLAATGDRDVLSHFETIVQNIFDTESVCTTGLCVAKIYPQLIHFLLNNHTAYQNPKHHVSCLIQYLNILIKQEAFEDALQLLNTAYKIAQSNELFKSWLVLITTKGKLIDDGIIDSSEWKNNIYANIKVKEKEINYNRYLRISEELSLLTTTKINQRKNITRIQSFLQLNLLKAETSALSTKAKIAYHEIKINIYSCLVGLDKLAFHQTKLLAYYQNTPNYLLENFTNHITLVTNIIVTKIMQEQEEEALILIDELKSFPLKYPDLITEDLEKEIVLISFCRETWIYLRNNEIDKVLSMIPTVENCLSDGNSNNKRLYQQLAVTRVANIYYRMNDFDTALYWLNLLVKYQHFNIGIDLQVTGLLIKNIIYLEQNKFNFLQKNIAEIKNYYSTYKIKGRFENLFLEMLIAIKKTGLSAREIKFIYEEYHLLLTAILNAPEEKSEYSFFVVQWLEKRIG